MARLADFRAYLADRRQVLQETEQRLCRLQEKYETYFAEVAAVREAELRQLTAVALRDRASLPDWFGRAIDQRLAEVEKAFDTKLSALEQTRGGELETAEQAREHCLKVERNARKTNLRLDTEEEQLKSRNEKLLTKIEEHNRRIRELGRGFGFFANFFSMRSLARQRQTLGVEQADMAARIERLRDRWAKADSALSTRQAQLRQKWQAHQDAATALSAKIDALRGARSSMVTRSTLEAVLADQVRDPGPAQPNGPKCPRCQTPLPDTSHFCPICAVRLGEDRPDFAGSLEEIAEIGGHHRRFSEGMKACQEIIGLVRGLKSGVEAFTKSIEDVMETERKYPLPKLEIEVPPPSVEFGRHFDGLRASAGSDMSLHPAVFADKVGSLIREVLNEEAIKAYFEGMGDELSRRAEAQW